MKPDENIFCLTAHEPGIDNDFSKLRSVNVGCLSCKPCICENCFIRMILISSRCFHTSEKELKF